MRTLTITVDIAVAPDAVMAYASNPLHLPQWAPGFASSISPSGDEWLVRMADGTEVRLWFTPPNADGILDHVVYLPDGEEVMNTMRVTPGDAGGSTVSFVLHQRQGMNDAELMRDAELVRADLLRLRSMLED